LGTGPHPARRRARRSPMGAAGFTLLEVVLVLLIIGIVVAVMFPRFTNIGGGDLKLEARTLIGRIQGLYAEATFTRRPHRLVLDLDEERYYAEVMNVETRTFAPVERTFMAPVQLPSGITLKDVTTARSGKRAEGQVMLLFDPMGQAEFATIHLEDRDGGALTLEINPLTGRVAVKEGYVETTAG
jgi:prepilin-type N-terminal cleavage/methylation domain-containing protein